MPVANALRKLGLCGRPAKCLLSKPRNATATDRLDYKYGIFARSIVKVTDDSIETATGNSANLSGVGLFAPWGVGKSKLWELIKGNIKKTEPKLID